jgi:putative acetyltransferase
MKIAIEPVREATPEAIALLAELDDILGAEYAPHQRHALSLDQLFQPDVRFFIARVQGEAAGCGGVAFFADYAEVKRMYVRERVRRQGIGRALLERLEGEARAAAKPVLRLETGLRQREAVGLYESWGFRPRSAFGHYAELAPASIATSLFYEKPL